MTIWIHPKTRLRICLFIGQAAEVVALGFHLAATYDYCSYETYALWKADFPLAFLVIDAFLPCLPPCQAGA